MIPPYAYVAHLNGWGSRVKIHRWGVQLGTLSVVWWALWAHSLCWEVSRRKSTPVASSCGHKECTPNVCEWI
jgi:hypothetical protein